MAAIFVDGFDYYDTIGSGALGGPVERHWLFVGSPSSFVAGRHNATFSNNIAFATGGAETSSTPFLGNESTLIIGFAMNMAIQNSPQAIVYITDSGSTQITLSRDANGFLFFNLGTGTGSPIAGTTGTTLIRENIWYHVEMKVTINNTTGSVHLKLNEQDEIHSGGGPVTGLDTQTTANAYTNRIGLAGINFATTYFDDFYILNTTPESSGPPNNDFIGDVAVETLFADANGVTNDWTPLSGSNYENIDEHATDDDASYVFSSTTSAIDLYSYDNLEQINQSDIHAVQTPIMARKTAAGGRFVTNVIRHGATNYAGNTLTTTDDYGELLQIHPSNPGTGSAWTTSDIDNAQFGIELIS